MSGKATRAIVSFGVPAIVAVIVVAAVAAAREFRSDPGSDAADASRGRTIIINPHRGESFTPVPFPHDAGYLSAEEAWRQWEHGRALPDSIPATYGLFTRYTGPPGAPGVEMREDGLPVWGYQERYCIVPLGGPGAVSSSPRIVETSATSPGHCTTWTFLDAATGDQILTTSVPNRGG